MGWSWWENGPFKRANKERYTHICKRNSKWDEVIITSTILNNWTSCALLSLCRPDLNMCYLHKLIIVLIKVPMHVIMIPDLVRFSNFTPWLGTVQEECDQFFEEEEVSLVSFLGDKIIGHIISARMKKLMFLKCHQTLVTFFETYCKKKIDWKMSQVSKFCQ